MNVDIAGTRNDVAQRKPAVRALNTPKPKKRRRRVRMRRITNAWLTVAETVRVIRWNLSLCDIVILIALSIFRLASGVGHRVIAERA